MKKFDLQRDNLKVRILDSAEQLGEAAALSVAKILGDAISEKGFANLILATGASQFQFLEHLQKLEIVWDKINVFHLDEYKDLPESHPASFRKYLKERIINNVQPKNAYFLNGDVEDVEAEVLRYETLLREHPFGVACYGIG